MHKTEKQFASYIMGKMKKEGMLTVRIESASTISGMPDLYVMGTGEDYFIEFKNMPKASIHDKQWKIAWRPGQQSWAIMYSLHHCKYLNDKTIRKCSWTFVGLSDGVLLIRTDFYRPDNIVKCDDHNVFIFSNKVLQGIQFRWWLATHSHVIIPISQDSDTIYDFTQRLMYAVAEHVAPVKHTDLDIPTPDTFIHGYDLEELIGDSDISFEYIYRNVTETFYNVYDSHIHNGGR